MEVSIEPVAYRFQEPLATAYGTLASREVLLLRLRGSDGVEGVGEAAPLEPYDRVSLAAAREALETVVPRLEDSDGAEHEELVAVCPLPQARAAVDLALWDLAGRRAGRPVAALLADEPAGSVPVNATVGALEPASAASEAGAAARDGYRCVKVKVGRADDGARVAAVRAAVGPEVAIRLDANGAWGVDEAVGALAELSAHGLELCEEPVHGLGPLREVRSRTSVPIAMDETAADDGALSSGATDLLCLKVARHGGISGTLAAAREWGGEAYLASSFDGPVGIAAALHVAAALRVQRPCGLATLGLFEGQGVPAVTVGGALAVPSGPGLGAAP